MLLKQDDFKFACESFGFIDCVNVIFIKFATIVFTWLCNEFMIFI